MALVESAAHVLDMITLSPKPWTIAALAGFCFRDAAVLEESFPCSCCTTKNPSWEPNCPTRLSCRSRTSSRCCAAQCCWCLSDHAPAQLRPNRVTLRENIFRECTVCSAKTKNSNFHLFTGCGVGKGSRFSNKNHPPP